MLFYVKANRIIFHFSYSFVFYSICVSCINGVCTHTHHTGTGTHNAPTFLRIWWGLFCHSSNEHHSFILWKYIYLTRQEPPSPSIRAHSKSHYIFNITCICIYCTWIYLQTYSPFDTFVVTRYVYVFRRSGLWIERSQRVILSKWITARFPSFPCIKFTISALCNRYCMVCSTMNLEYVRIWIANYGMHIAQSNFCYCWVVESSAQTTVSTNNHFTPFSIPYLFLFNK